MNLAEKICITAAFIFFMTGLFAGIWKYLLMVKSEDSRSRYYVDVAHRVSFIYAVSSLLLGYFAHYSIFPGWLNIISAFLVCALFASAILVDLITGLKSDTNNQIRESKNGAAGFEPMWMVNSYMLLVIIGEVTGSAILGIGALLRIWS